MGCLGSFGILALPLRQLILLPFASVCSSVKWGQELRSLSQWLNIEWYPRAVAVGCPGNGEPGPSWLTGLWPRSNEDVDKNRGTRTQCALWGMARGCQSDRPPSWLPVLGPDFPFVCRQETGIHYHRKHLRPHRQTTALSVVCTLPSNVPRTYGNT